MFISLFKTTTVSISASVATLLQ